ncbi:uncharacterized protein LOC107863358 isoform X1 [Capsicum annuum]|uniref:uncharacterized protein LOC107863358 isoform X1 n=1 Tax=Capsicum annuum TaxID=4072 RepID=UPI001FB0E12A|nr:uncharacterized protein LOC107863358 isoform X1 [Capsicum annuum]
MSVYDRELLALLFVISKWSHHLLGRRFIVNTDQKALKYLLNQSIHPDFQVACISKVMTFDFCIEYKKGVENKVADALSRKPDTELLAISVLGPQGFLLDRIRHSWTTDQHLQDIIARVQLSPYKSFTFLNNQLRWKERLVVGNDEQLKKDIISLWHNSTQGGHFGMDATIKRLQSLFYWKDLIHDTRNFINRCVIYQRHKYDMTANLGLLQPLPVPDGVWTDIYLDFVEGLPKSKGNEVILVVVDRLSKYGHFLPLAYPYTAQSVAQYFLDNIFKLHGMPNILTSDRDPIFHSDFWEELFSLQGVQLQRSTAYHPQTDGQTEVLNRTMETILKVFLI